MSETLGECFPSPKTEGQTKKTSQAKVKGLQFAPCNQIV